MLYITTVYLDFMKKYRKHTFKNGQGKWEKYILKLFPFLYADWTKIVACGLICDRIET